MYLVDIHVVVETWQLISVFVGLIIAIISATVAICRFAYTLKERIKVLEIKFERQEKELEKFTNFFQDVGFNILKEKAKRGKA